MHLTINGEQKNMNRAMTVAELVEALGLDVTKLAVERNNAIVPRSTYATAALNDGDAIEIVHFIGGG